jgi:hypothetical protein
MRPFTLGNISYPGAIACPKARRISKITPSSLPKTQGIGGKYFVEDNRPIILFDGVCNL